MGNFVYSLSAITCIACAMLLLRSFKSSGARLLLWSGVCFLGLAVNNALAFLDVNTPSEIVDLSTVRLAVSVLSLVVLVYGLVWESS